LDLDSGFDGFQLVLEWYSMGTGLVLDW